MNRRWLLARLDWAESYTRVQNVASLFSWGGSAPQSPQAVSLQTSYQSQVSKIRPLERTAHTSRCSTGNPNYWNDHIYHFHTSKSFDLIFVSICRGRGGAEGGGAKGKLHYAHGCSKLPGWNSFHDFCIHARCTWYFGCIIDSFTHSAQVYQSGMSY